MKIFILILVLLCLVGTASATDYYVSTTGNNASDGLTSGTAWRNVSYGTSQLTTAGDTLYVIDGTYYKERCVISTSGNATHPITVTAYNGTPTLIGTTNWTGDMTSSGSAISAGTGVSYWNFNGFTITNYTLPFKVPVNGVFINISNNNITHFYLSCVAATTGSKDITIYGNKIGEFDNPTQGNSLQLACDAAGNICHNISIINNEIWNNSVHGLIDLMGPANNTKIIGNVLRDQPQNAGAAIYEHYGPMFYTNISNNIIYKAGGLHLTKLRDSICANNIVYNLTPSTYGIYSYAGSEYADVDNVTIYNNTVYNCDVLMDISGASDRTFVLENNNFTSFNVRYAYFTILNQKSSRMTVIGKAKTFVKYTNNNVFTVASYAGAGAYTIGEKRYYPTYSGCYVNSTDAADRTIQITKTNKTVTPSEDYCTVTMSGNNFSKIQMEMPISHNINITVSSDEPTSIANFNLSGIDNNITITINGTPETTVSPIGGWANWSYSGGFSEVVFNFQEGAWTPTTNHIYLGKRYSILKYGNITQHDTVIESDEDLTDMFRVVIS